MKDYYKILEVDPKATNEQIKAQYHFLVHAWHPDKFPDNQLKSKAEEKLKEINEAYSVLSDTSKRENYDRAFRSYSSQPKPQTQNSYTQPVETTSTQSKQKTQSIGYCQSCFLPAETKYVEFHENIGMVFMRQHRAVKGNLCKSCIDYYFWNLTGKTMLLGWWGIISFIVTPFILLNNLFRFIFTTGMKKPPLKIAPSPTPFWVFSTIGGFMLIGFIIFSIISSASVQTSTLSYSPTTVPAVPPTKIPPIETKQKTDDQLKYIDYIEYSFAHLAYTQQELKDISLLGVSFEEDEDGKLWLVIGITGSENAKSDWDTIAGVSVAVSSAIVQSTQDGYELETKPYGIMTMFFTTENKIRCGAVIVWDAIEDFANETLSTKDFLAEWIYPVLPDNT